MRTYTKVDFKNVSLDLESITYKKKQNKKQI